jgi:hypothetical protein
VKSIEEFIKEVEAAKKNWIKVIRPKLVAKEVKPKGEKTDEKDADKEQLISRGPIRICSRSVGGYQPYTTAEHGVAPQSTTNDPSNFNPNVYNYTYDCGVGGYDYYWANSCETVSSNSATPDTVNSDPNCIHEDAAVSEISI